uniref:Serine hydrolase domain-containing protein n=1 Tax=Chromera velia CCMP2878 TaxID=1169474 RepID=A0A0G4HI68_9ALVE|eukprot:Cvel_6920.t2-p1 / transcript=Cvel_6920.t2 / gene=Cvel_6920 / organism=Chromera_velia_CCMP2878 / gene_product=Ovarian cancer-associated gene 2 protein homolog, putative / transcript_product=Ovarian cancer-associated gene 2 protein homolog, putative / location=Cvel_scaffold350:31558-36455(+) / protein_length=227 / sequence_SO=supercontig / SO=protein_coding / is_pseudo=false
MALRVLCLPGWRTNKSILSDQLDLAGFRSFYGDILEFVCIDGTFDAEGEPTPDVKQIWPTGPYFQWWTIDDAQKGPKTYHGAEKSVDRVASILKEEGPFQGILGFSQGACLTNLIAAKKCSGDKRFEDISFVIPCSGFIPRDPDMAPLFETPLQIPSLHVAGEKDQLFPASVDAVSKYDSSTSLFIQHPGGHSLPRLPEAERTKFRGFLVKLLNGGGGTQAAGSSSL